MQQTRNRSGEPLRHPKSGGRFGETILGETILGGAALSAAAIPASI
jgi:hypothetical protein